MKSNSTEKRARVLVDFFSANFKDFFGLVGFYGISTMVGYLKPNPIYTHVVDL